MAISLALWGAVLCCCLTVASAAVVERKWREEQLPRERVRATVKPGPLKVFILAGQSNMVGMGATDMVNNSDPNHGQLNGTLKYLVSHPRTKEEFSACVNASGNWTVRDDVWMWSNDEGGPDSGYWGPFSVGYGAGAYDTRSPPRIGPEYGFGFVVGDAIEEQVLIIKTAWGGRSLAQDFRPPSSGGTVGATYEIMLAKVQMVLANLTHLFPAYNATAGYEISGFGWFLGWNDGCSASDVSQYETNMVNLIKDLRKEWKVADMPASIPISCFSGWDEKIPRRLGIIQAQFNSANATLHPDINNAQNPSVMAEETRMFWRAAQYSPSNREYHLNFNAETYWYIGKVMGQAMVKMMKPAM